MGKFELIVLLALVVTMLFVGGKKLPELARGVGQSAKELKKGFSDDDTEAKAPAKKTTKK
ncbi:MAG: twin-arginine translocase TatA/TatE family subunit [Candidatus Saccharibacteria bacterium]|nr:twin-arginine translocase TatA/TatE family subunit [Candidatus Saccharibacteria bacterium]